MTPPQRPRSPYRATKAPAEPQSANRTRRTPFVLLVDDDPDARNVYERYLTARGFRVQGCADGLQALAAARIERPDLIVMDLSMPHLDGLEATRRLKADPVTASVPVIACTGRVLSAFVERALEAGCAAYLVKPCLPMELLAEIRRVLGLRQTERAHDNWQRRAMPF